MVQGRVAGARALAPLLAAAALMAGAFAAVQRAGCDDPGRYEQRADGYELVGGCVAPGDIVVPDPGPLPAPAPDPDAARG
ncbi:MAG TPA: hypothetical protein VM367_19020 [Pseudonocardia sp.]|jgi:hypothetical protein|nr:hypothetical protein [Pseudonocardia sp.]